MPVVSDYSSATVMSSNSNNLSKDKNIKDQQKKLIIDIMNDDAKDGLYKKQTAVEWLIEQLEGDDSKIARVIGLKKYNSLIQQAKEMEKQQIIDATCLNEYVNEDDREIGERYYKEEYGGEKSSKIEISDEELEHELLNFLYGFEYEVFPHSASYKFDYEACAKALTQRFKEILKNKQ